MLCSLFASLISTFLILKIVIIAKVSTAELFTFVMNTEFYVCCPFSFTPGPAGNVFMLCLGLDQNSTLPVFVAFVIQPCNSNRQDCKRSLNIVIILAFIYVRDNASF